MTRSNGRLANRRQVLNALAAASSGAIAACLRPAQSAPSRPGALAVVGTRLVRGGAPYLMSGFNHWAASTLAREGDEAGWDQVRRDLDSLQDMGVTAVRTLGASEGPFSEPLRVTPAIQPSAGEYDSAGVSGLLRLIEEMEARGLSSIVILNNFWPWSGGMAQYLAWSGEGGIPYPPPASGGTWDRYTEYASRFYLRPRARDLFEDYVRFIVPHLAGSHSVVWELANEPRGMAHVGEFRTWIDRTARLIKSLAPHQLVTTGSEGLTASPLEAGLDVVLDHASSAVDFITCHLWAENWGWVRPERLAADFPYALRRALDYVRQHAALAATLGKPIIVEEFGFPRDGGRFEPGAPTSLRDAYFQNVYALVGTLAESTPLAGIMPWAWSGARLPPRPGGLWAVGDPLTGDPPHEPQGWYSIYASDSTRRVVREGSARLAGVAASLSKGHAG